MMDAAQATSRSDDGECVSRTSEQWELDYYDEIDALACRYPSLTITTACLACPSPIPGPALTVLRGSDQAL